MRNPIPISRKAMKGKNRVVVSTLSTNPGKTVKSPPKNQLNIISPKKSRFVHANALFGPIIPAPLVFRVREDIFSIPTRHYNR